MAANEHAVETFPKLCVQNSRGHRMYCCGCNNGMVPRSLQAVHRKQRKGACFYAGWLGRTLQEVAQLYMHNQAQQSHMEGTTHGNIFDANSHMQGHAS